jgi:hypothetical protein
VQAVGQLHEHDPKVGDHRQDHFSEGLGLLVLARHVGELADLRQPVDQLGDLDAELLRDRLLGGQRVLERDVQGVDQVRLARAAHLAPMLAGGEDVGPPQQVQVAGRVVGLDFFEDFLEVDHALRVNREGGYRKPVAVSREP